MFSPALTKVPSTSLGCGLAVNRVAYASGSLLPAVFDLFLYSFQMGGAMCSEVAFIILFILI